MPPLVNTTQVPTSEEPGDGTTSHDDAGALGGREFSQPHSGEIVHLHDLWGQF